MPRTARPSASRTSAPLGSLTQGGARGCASCRSCGSDRVTALAMSLTDGSPVEFVSCHACEHRTWLTEAGHVLDISGVLDRTRKTRRAA